MTWNWEQNDWPNFRYDESQLRSFEGEFLKESGIILGIFRYMSEDEKLSLRVQLLSTEAVKTSAIEGEYLNWESVQSSIQKHLGLKVDFRRASLAEQGISELLVHLVETCSQPLTHDMLFSWHEMVMRGRRDLDVGQYRTSLEPMQVISGWKLGHKVHFEAPPSSRVFEEMERFVYWFNGAWITPLLKSGLAHLYFESIHPFEDGNGRIGRLLSEKLLAQHFDEPMLLFLSRTIEANKKEYYEALEKANKSNEVTDWLLYFSRMVLVAQKETQRTIAFLIEKTKFFDQFCGLLNLRQEKVLLRMMEEGSGGFQGGMSAEKYIRLTKTTRATATRDLHDLVVRGALLRTGERKHTRYHLPFGDDPVN